MSNNLLITGAPGVGKTTLIRRVLNDLPAGIVMKGFITEEIRESGYRVGFEVASLQGIRDVLAHRDFVSSYSVGRYSVDMETFERFLMMLFDQEDTQLWVIDEIGKMECFSQLFCRSMRRLLDSSVPLFGSLSARGGGFIGEVKLRKDCEVINVTQSNRDVLIPTLTRKLQRLIQQSKNADDK